MEALFLCLIMLTTCKLVLMEEPTTKSVCPYGEDKCDAVTIVRMFAKNISSLLSWKVEIENQYNTEIITLKNEMSALKNETLALNNKTSTLTDALNDETALNNALKKEISALKKTLKKKTTLLRMNKRLKKLHTRIWDGIEPWMSKTRSLIDALTDKMTAQKDEISELKDTVALLKNTMPDLFRNCDDFYKSGLTQSGVYNMTIRDRQNELHQVPVYCDMDTANGGWTVFQRRQDGTVRFDQTWNKYKKGFGDLWGEFWLGNKWIALMTGSSKKFMLRVDMESIDNETRYAQYENFKISREKDNYSLHIESYSGTSGDVLSSHNGTPFGTKDVDSDWWRDVHCVLESGGGAGFWYGGCEMLNLNSDSDFDDLGALLGIKTLKRIEMKLKPMN